MYYDEAQTFNMFVLKLRSIDLDKVIYTIG